MATKKTRRAGLGKKSSGLLSELAKIIKHMPRKRLIQPKEIAHVVLFLLKNKGVTGQTIVVDGGYNLSIHQINSIITANPFKHSN